MEEDVISKGASQVYQFEIESRAKLHPIGSASDSYQEWEHSQSGEGQIIKELNADADLIARKLAQELRQRLAAQYGEGIEVRAEVDFHYGSIILFGNVIVVVHQVLQGMDLAGGVIGFIAYT